MKIIFRQQIFLHHLLCPSNITSRKELLFLGWTQPLWASDCIWPLPVVWAMLHYWSQSTPGLNLVWQQQEAVSVVCWDCTSWSLSVTVSTGTWSVSPLLTGPYLYEQSSGFRKGHSLVSVNCERAGALRSQEPLGGRGGGCCFILWVVFRAVESWIFFFFFWQDFGFKRKNSF